MIDRATLLGGVKDVAWVASRIAILAVVILVLDVVGLGLYDLFTGANLLSRLRFIVLAEGVVMMVIGFWQIATTPRTGSIGSKPVHPSTREIREQRDTQEYRLLIGIAGFMLFILALFGL